MIFLSTNPDTITSLHYILFTRDDKPPLYPIYAILFTRDDKPPATYDHTHQRSTTLLQPAHTRTPHAYRTNKNGTLPRKSCAGESTNTYITWNYSRTRTM